MELNKPVKGDDIQFIFVRYYVYLSVKYIIFITKKLLHCCQVLLALKSDVEDRGTKGDRTPLMEAACGGYLDIVRLLLAHKANVNAQAPSGNLTSLAAESCNCAVSKDIPFVLWHCWWGDSNDNKPLKNSCTCNPQTLLLGDLRGCSQTWS